MNTTGEYNRLSMSVYLERMGGVYSQSIFSPVALLTLITLLGPFLSLNSLLPSLLLTLLPLHGILFLKLNLLNTILANLPYYTFATIYIDLHLALATVALLLILLPTLLQCSSNIPLTSLPLQSLHRQPSAVSREEFLPKENQGQIKSLVWLSKITRVGLPCSFLLLQILFWISVASFGQGDVEGMVKF